MKPSEYEKIKEFSKNHFQDSQNYVFKIPEQQQQAEVQKLKYGLREEQFFVVVDLLNFKLLEFGGIEELGYKPENFSLQQYLDMISVQGLMSMLTVLGKQTFELSKTDLIGFLKPSYIVLAPMLLKKHGSTQYLVKRIISPWQITACGKITAYLTHCTIVKEYEYEALYPRIEGIPEDYRKIVMKSFETNFKQLKAVDNKLAPKELILLEYYLETKNLKLVAEKAEITLQTLKDYNKKILQKARSMYGDSVPFRTAMDVALFLKNNGILQKKHHT